MFNHDKENEQLSAWINSWALVIVMGILLMMAIYMKHLEGEVMPKVIEPISEFKPFVIEALHREKGLEEINVAEMNELTNVFAHIYYQQSLIGDQFSKFLLKQGEVVEARKIVESRPPVVEVEL